MKSVKLTLAAAFFIACPTLAHAQYGFDDRRDPTEYRDIDDGQLLRLAGYILTPIGMGLEWGLTRPLHHLAAQSPIAPLMSGDVNVFYFGHNDNANLVPSGTFALAPMNLSNVFVKQSPDYPVTPLRIEETPITATPPARQPTLH
jgi:hypothetical protein